VVLCTFSQRALFLVVHGIVGGQIPVGAGLAFADKYFETGVTMTYFVMELHVKAHYTKL
jgi:TPP-dependent pyruvate/acetoin dehydrogenase alpha subunit